MLGGAGWRQAGEGGAADRGGESLGEAGGAGRDRVRRIGVTVAGWGRVSCFGAVGFNLPHSAPPPPQGDRAQVTNVTCPLSPAWKVPFRHPVEKPVEKLWSDFCQGDTRG